MLTYKEKKQEGKKFHIKINSYCPFTAQMAGHDTSSGSIYAPQSLRNVVRGARNLPTEPTPTLKDYCSSYVETLI